MALVDPLRADNNRRARSKHRTRGRESAVDLCEAQAIWADAFQEQIPFDSARNVRHSHTHHVQTTRTDALLQLCETRATCGEETDLDSLLGPIAANDFPVDTDFVTSHRQFAPEQQLQRTFHFSLDRCRQRHIVSQDARIFEDHYGTCTLQSGDGLEPLRLSFAHDPGLRALEPHYDGP